MCWTRDLKFNDVSPYMQVSVFRVFALESEALVCFVQFVALESLNFGSNLLPTSSNKSIKSEALALALALNERRVISEGRLYKSD